MRCYLGGHSKLNIVSRDRQGSGFPRGLWFIFCDIVGPTSQSIPFQGMLRGAKRRGGKSFFKNLFRRKVMQCSYCGDRYTDDQYSSEHKATGHKWIVNESPADPADLTDAEGWKVVKAADCLNAASAPENLLRLRRNRGESRRRCYRPLCRWQEVHHQPLQS